MNTASNLKQTDALTALTAAASGGAIVAALAAAVVVRRENAVDFPTSKALAAAIAAQDSRTIKTKTVENYLAQAGSLRQHIRFASVAQMGDMETIRASLAAALEDGGYLNTAAEVAAMLKGEQSPAAARKAAAEAAKKAETAAALEEAALKESDYNEWLSRRKAAAAKPIAAAIAEAVSAIREKETDGEAIAAAIAADYPALSTAAAFELAKAIRRPAIAALKAAKEAEAAAKAEAAAAAAREAEAAARRKVEAFSEAEAAAAAARSTWERLEAAAIEAETDYQDAAAIYAAKPSKGGEKILAMLRKAVDAARREADLAKRAAAGDAAAIDTREAEAAAAKMEEAAETAAITAAANLRAAGYDRLAAAVEAA